MKLLTLVCVATVVGCCSGQLVRYSFNYHDGPNSRAESLDAFGIVRGTFSYLNAKGDIKTQHYDYVAEAIRPQVNKVEPGNTLPEPKFESQPQNVVEKKDTAEPPAYILELAQQTKEFDTPENADTFTVVPGSRKKRAVTTLSSPLSFSYGFPVPLPYFHPAVRSHLPYTAAVPTLTTYGTTAFTGLPAFTTHSAATPAVVGDARLLRMVHNPGHATSYRME